MLKGTCAVCGKTKTQFVKSGSGLFSKAVNNLPFELHLPGHNFTGPGTKLDRRLNPDGTPRVETIGQSWDGSSFMTSSYDVIRKVNLYKKLTSK